VGPRIRWASRAGSAIYLSALLGNLGWGTLGVSHGLSRVLKAAGCFT